LQASRWCMPMSSSELSNALNPYVVQTRSRSSNPSYSPALHPVVQPPQQYVPHRSELELAISEPPPPPPPDNNVRPRNPPSDIRAMQEFLRMLTATKASQEIERKRRIAWEQEQEAKYTQRHAEMEKQMLEMKQEIISLKAFVGLHTDMSANDQRQPATTTFQRQGNGSPMVIHQPTPQTSQSPVSTLSAQPTFVQGS